MDALLTMLKNVILILCCFGATAPNTMKKAIRLDGFFHCTGDRFR